MTDELATVLRDIFVRKAEARLERARLPYGQKVLIVEKIRREVAPLREAGCHHRAREAAGGPR